MISCHIPSISAPYISYSVDMNKHLIYIRSSQASVFLLAIIGRVQLTRADKIVHKLISAVVKFRHA